MAKNSKVIDVDYSTEMKDSYLSYAMSVITSRAIPDVRDGLKPVHRRILYAMNELKVSPDKPYKKSARIVGDVLGKYHPHGDASIYDAMVRLAQDYKTNHPLVDGHGNYGSIDGDSAAAMRYTEARLSPMAMELLTGLDKGVVEFRDNYEQSLQEPEVLRAKYCNLLVNGSEGVAVGMATNIPPHNLNEVNNACKAYLENPDITERGILQYIKGPDFPTGGLIINGDEIKNIYENGKGRIRIRAVIDEEEGERGRKNLVIKEIPYTQSGRKSALMDEIIDLISERKLSEITDVRDESDLEGVRIVLEVRKGEDLEILKDKLFHMTKLEDTMPFNLLAISRGKPVEFTIKGVIREYCEFLRESYIKEINHDLDKLKKEEERYKGLLEAIDLIDLIIEIIRGSKDRKQVMNCLVKGKTAGIKFKSKESEKEAASLSFTEYQADEILKLQLQRLMSLEVENLNMELKKVVKEIRICEEYLNNEDKLVEYMIEGLDEVKDKHGRYRRTKIETIDTNEYVEEKDSIVEDLHVLIDRFNYIKVIDDTSFMRANEETIASYSHVLDIKSNDSIFMVSKDNKVVQYKIDDLPTSRIQERGEPMPSDLEILEIGTGETLRGRLILFATKNGYVKRVKWEDLESIRREVIATNLVDGDELIFVKALDGHDKEVVMRTKKRELRFDIEEVSIQGKGARGVIGIKLDKDDEVLEVEITRETNNVKFSRASKGKEI